VLLLKLSPEKPAIRDEEGDKVTFHTPLGKKIYDAANPKPRPPKNELFFPGRMFFRFEIDEDFGSDVPTNVIRSKAEFSDFQVLLSLTCSLSGPANLLLNLIDFQSKMVVPSSDLVIGKIVQLVANIRQGTRPNEAVKKMKKKEKTESKEPVQAFPVRAKPVVDLDDE